MISEEVKQRVRDAARAVADRVDWSETFGGVDIFSLMTDEGAAECRKWLTAPEIRFIVKYLYDRWDWYGCLFDDDGYNKDDVVEQLCNDGFDAAPDEYKYKHRVDQKLRFDYDYYDFCDSPWTLFGEMCYDWLTEEYQDPQTKEQKEKLYRVGLIKDGWKRLTRHGVLDKTWEDENWWS